MKRKTVVTSAGNRIQIKHYKHIRNIRITQVVELLYSIFHPHATVFLNNSLLFHDNK